MGWKLLRRLDENYEELFSCPHCGNASTTPIIICDGTALALQADRAQFAPRESFIDTSAVKQGSSHYNRVLISDPSVRKAINHFVGDGGKRGKPQPFAVDGVNIFLFSCLSL